MNAAFVITPNVINTINSLPMKERVAITSALASEMILGSDPCAELTPLEQMVYAMIKDYVERDTRRVAI